MQKLAFVFPGQGSQKVGMLAELAAQYPVVGQTFAEASDALGFDLWAMVQEGPQWRLARAPKNLRRQVLGEDEDAAPSGPPSTTRDSRP